MIINVNPKNTMNSTHFPDGGYCFLKNNSFSVAISITNSEQKYKKGHIHLDVGSIAVSFRGMPIVVDLGTYTYTRDITKRKENISYFNHNVPIINTEEINGAVMPGIFGIEIENRLTVLQHTEKSISFIHSYFNTDILRKIEVEDNELNIIDSARKPLLSYFHLHPDVIVSNVKRNKYLNLIVGDTELFFQSSKKIYIEKYSYSEGYGRINSAFKIIAESDGLNGSKIKIH